jgi:prophage regulatory protein
MPKIIDTLAQFDRLPDSGFIDVRTVAGLLGVHVATVWRLAKAGELPPPIKLGPSTTRWRVSDVRTYLAALDPV